MAKRKPARRAEERARARTHERLVRDLERLAGHAAGGSPRRPIDVEAPTQVEPIAQGTSCPLCEGGLRLENHAAETHDGIRLRVAHVRCTRCGTARALYFRLANALPH
jgi:hypothetical protein